MTEEKKPDQAPPAFDPVEFKKEVTEMNKSYVDQVTQSVVAQVANLIATKEKVQPEAEKSVSVDDELTEYSPELAELGLDGKEGKALLGMFKKVVKNEAPKFEKNVINKVDKHLTTEKVREDYEGQVIKKYPQALDKSSNLWRRANEVFAGLSESIQKSPEGKAIAVRLAADDLGIAPVSLQQANAQDGAPIPGGGAGKSDKVNAEQIEFANSFGVNKETFQKNLKIVSNR